jgi:hypothetical protein
MTGHHDRESPKHLFAVIREVLIRDWDPLGLSDAPGAPDDYDNIAREVHAILTGPEASAERIAAFLRWAEREQMGLQRRPGEATAAAARIMALKGEGNETDGK